MKRETDQLLTAQELASRLKVSKNTALAMLARNTFPQARKVGRQWRVPASAVTAYFDKPSGVAAAG